MAENVKVIVRCRPMNKKELDLKCKVNEMQTLFVKKFLKILMENVIKYGKFKSNVIIMEK